MHLKFLLRRRLNSFKVPCLIDRTCISGKQAPRCNQIPLMGDEAQLDQSLRMVITRVNDKKEDTRQNLEKIVLKDSVKRTKFLNYSQSLKY